MKAMSIFSAAHTDIGLARHVNEDAVAVLPPGAGERRHDFLAVVADGMGGHGHGDTASRLAVEAVMDAYPHADASLVESVRRAVVHANAAVFRAAKAQPALRGMGTTCTAIAIRGGEVACAHVGDSRFYLIRDGAIYVMTEDHSVVRECVAKGLLTAEAARTHADRNVLLRAIGTSADVDVEAWPHPLPLRDGDRLLLCTDGLHGLVSDEELCAIAGRDDADTACRELIALARARGGYDNITAAVIQIGDPSHHGDL